MVTSNYAVNIALDAMNEQIEALREGFLGIRFSCVQTRRMLHIGTKRFKELAEDGALTIYRSGKNGFCLGEDVFEVLRKRAQWPKVRINIK